MRVLRSSLVVIVLLAPGIYAMSQTPPPSGRGGQPTNITPSGPGLQPQPGRGGRGGRGGVPVMTMTTSAWPDGGQIPAKHSQVGAEVSPPLSWSNVPDGVSSFVLLFHDLDAAVGNGTDDVLHWMLWNIPGSARNLPEGVPHANQLPDGTRQISVSGPYYRGPGALASGPPHHYAFELFALDTMVDVPPVGQSPALTRAAVVAAMAGHVRGKAAYLGLFKRQ